MLDDTAQPSEFPALRQREHLGPDAAQRLVILAAQVVTTRIVAVFMDEQPHHVLGDAVLEPVRAEPEFVEDEFTAGAVGRAAASGAATGPDFARCTSESDFPLLFELSVLATNQ